MASTVANDKGAVEYQEIIDSVGERDKKIRKMASLMKKHRGKVVFFTGAGISTGAGIPDFRSGLNSATGMPAGKWCQEATQGQWTQAEKDKEAGRQRKTTSCLQAIPTASHMALVALHLAGFVSGLISQNCDGLHRRSGFDSAALAELHGNTNLEYCAWCGKEYFRDFRASNGRRTRGQQLKKELWEKHSKLDLINPRRGNHYTGRRCQQKGCEGYLFDSTIDFGDNLPDVHIKRGYDLANSAELCIVLGSRCSVSPACNMPISVGKSKRPLVVVNLQRTAADNVATSSHKGFRIGAKIDDVMVPLMAQLGIPIPTFKLRRHIQVNHSREGAIEVYGTEADGTPVDCLWNVQADFGSHDQSVGGLEQVRVRLNQDANGRRMQASKLKPGDVGSVQTWPWENEEHPGMVSVRMQSGTANGKHFVLSASVCDVIDGIVSLQKTVFNAGQRHGHLLAHRVPPLPATAQRRQEGSNAVAALALTLMFRAHYGEPPLQVAVPSRCTAHLYELEYEPMTRVWDAKLLKKDAHGVSDAGHEVLPASATASPS